MYFFPKMALHDLYLINLKKNLQCQRLLFCVFFIGWMKLIGSWNKCKVYAWQSWRQLAFVVDVCTAKSVQRVSLLGDILYAIVYWASTVCYVCPWRRDTVCSSGKGRTDPIESNWSWTKHLIFLLWKIQCYLDGNKGGVWGWGGLLAQYVGWLVTQKQLVVLSASPCSASAVFDAPSLLEKQYLWTGIS